MKPHQVFVFGSNEQGFHGAGAAGQACRGDSRNTWRQDQWFRKALTSPVGSEDRVGRWAVVGVARGHQMGREGQSYAIVTCLRPGLRRSIPLDEIRAQFLGLFAHATSHPELEYLMTPVGSGLAGYTPAEMWRVWNEAITQWNSSLPSNIVVPSSLYQT